MSSSDSKVIAQLAMSLDGFVADPHDRCDELFGFYDSGPVPVALSPTFPVLHTSDTTARLLHQATDRVGAAVVGRRLYDLTNGWGGHTAGDVPMVVLTHAAPDDWPRDGVPIEFVAGAAEAVARARELAGGKDVSVDGAHATREVLDAGLLDEFVVSLVPVLLGSGIPWFAGARGPVRLSDPEVFEDAGVTHLRYRVLR
jgi:dihydrofolate reductase